MNAKTVTMHPINIEQVSALEAIARALKIKFEVAKEQPYDEKFVDMVLHAEHSIKQGKGKKLTSEEFDNLWK